MSNAPLMPMATAVWLVENTTLTFKQIADFCKLHEVEVQGIADGEVAKGIVGYNPIIAGQLSREEIKLSSDDPNRPLALKINEIEIEIKKLSDLISSLNKIISSKKELLKVISNELKEIKDKYAIPRRTKIIDAILNYDIEETIQKETVLITVTLQGYIKRGSLKTCLLYTSPSPRDLSTSRMPSSA